MQKVNMLKICLLATIIMMLFTSCSDELQEYDGPWELTYAYMNPSQTVTPSSNYLHWAADHEDNLVFAIPPCDDKDFSYSYGELLWKEIIYHTTEDKILEIVQNFNNFNNKTWSYEPFVVGYKKYDPNYNGPWLVTFHEYRMMAYNNSSGFKNWLESNINNNHCETALPELTTRKSPNNIYDKVGAFAWITVMNNISETSLKKMRDEFKSFSLPKNNEGYCDFFDLTYATYNPNTSSQTSEQ